MLPKLKWILLTFIFAQSQWGVTSLMYSKVTLRSIEYCKNPDPPYEKDPSIVLDVMAYNKSGSFYFKGNATVKRDLSGYFWQIKTGVEKSGTIKYLNSYKKLTCKSVIPRLVLLAANVRYNEKTCEIMKGNYTFKEMDFTKLDAGAHYFPIKEIGESIVYFSYFNSKGTAYCLLSRYVLKTN